MITAKELRAILESPEYVRDLADLSAYAASIKQERPMVLLLAKYLHRRQYRFALEEGGHDLVVDGTRIEFKFHYDFDIQQRLVKELEKHAGDIVEVSKAAHKTWSVIPGIYKDVISPKNADIFVWIICARDLDTLTDEDLKRVCVGRQQKRHNRDNPYGSDRFLLIVDAFLESLQQLRKFSVETATIATKGDFPSSYHFWLCEFAKSGP